MKYGIVTAAMGALCALGLGMAADRAIAQTSGEQRRMITDEQRRAEARAAEDRDITHRRDAYRDDHDDDHGEFYVAGFGGYTFAHIFNDVEGTSPRTPLPDVDLVNSAIYGIKLGYFLPERLNWLGVEVEGFNTTPHLRQSALGPGGDLRVTTVAFNLIARGKYGCDHDDYDRDRHARRVGTDRRYDDHHYGDRGFCRIQPYVGAGFGLFFANLDGGLTGNRSISDNATPGFNGLAGLRLYMTEHVAVFAEYKYNRATFEFNNALGVNGINGDYSVSNVVGGLSFHF